MLNAAQILTPVYHGGYSVCAEISVVWYQVVTGLLFCFATMDKHGYLSGTYSLLSVVIGGENTQQRAYKIQKSSEVNCHLIVRIFFKITCVGLWVYNYGSWAQFCFCTVSRGSRNRLEQLK